MKTKILSEKEIGVAARIIRNGGIVAFPTETVYGLGASAFDSSAIKKIFDAKGRPQDNPLIVHISKVEDLNLLVKEIPSKAKLLMKKFWPGPITFVFKKNSSVPDIVTAGFDSVAVRMPSNKNALKIIEKNGAIAAPRANISG